MFSVTQIPGQSNLPYASGTVEFNTNYVVARKPAWWVLLKLLCVFGMVTIGYGITVPTFLEYKFPLWQAIALATGAMVVYTAVAFFVRPDANTDNLGSTVNRFLWKAHCFLGPGRFTSQTLLEFFVVLGVKSRHDADDAVDLPEQFLLATTLETAQAITPVTGSSMSAGTLSPGRFETSTPNPFGGQQPLDSWKYMSAQK